MTEVIVWSGWLGGIAVGLYALSQLILTGKLLGASTGYGNVCSYISTTSYFHGGEYTNPNNWRLWFIVWLALRWVGSSLNFFGRNRSKFFTWLSI